MKIRKVECEQFAGIQNKKVEFTDGLNMVIGENESGKSTIVDLIYYLLFGDIKVNVNSNFFKVYFPKKLNGPQGDAIDGVLEFETQNGTYKISKEWNKGEGICKLTLPDGTYIKGNTEINKILSEELQHRAGVYNEIIFASQKRQETVIKSILGDLSKKEDSSSETKNDLAATLTKAALETGGVSLEEVEKKLQEKLELLGSRWDFSFDMPEGGVKRGINNVWKNEVGQILEAYYAMERVRRDQKEAENAEKAVEACNANISMYSKNKKEIETEKDQFLKIRGILDQRTLLENAIKYDKDKLNEDKEAFKKWPNIKSNIMKAKNLQKKLNDANIRDLYNKAEGPQKAYEEQAAKLKSLVEINPQDVTDAYDLQLDKQTAESKVAGLNLVARFKQLGEIPIEVKSVITEETLNIESGELKITEAIDVVIPGVMEMQLMPQDVDLDAIRTKLKQINSKIEDIFTKYNVKNFNELKEKDELYRAAEKETRNLETKKNEVLLGEKWEEVKVAYSNIPDDTLSIEEVEQEIAIICDSKTIEVYIGGLEQTLSDYEDKYGSIEILQLNINEITKEMESNQRKLDEIEAIPESFKEIRDTEEYEKGLLNKMTGFDEKIENYEMQLKEAERSLKDKSAEEYSEDLDIKESEFEALKTEYKHWENINNVFLKLKEQVSNSPMLDIEKRFKEYLDVITTGGLDLKSFDETMTIELASGTHKLSYNILSDGTKDTISLAFRLAMLEQLYPKGDGLAVFDDPFTDMDPKRAEQACKLIMKFAQNNQVIFLTCDDKYKDMMNGNIITIRR